MNDLDFTVQLISLVKKFDTPEQAIEAIKLYSHNAKPESQGR